MIVLRALTVTLFSLVPNAYIFASELPIDRTSKTEVSLVVRQGREIPPNVVRVNLVATATGRDWSVLLKNTSETMSAMSQKILENEAVGFVSGPLTTSIVEKPETNDEASNTAIFWKLDQHFFLTTENPSEIFPVLSEYVPGVIVRNVEYSLSKDRQENAEREVASLALAELKRQAELVSKTAGAVSFSITKMDMDIRLLPPTPSGLPKESDAENVQHARQASVMSNVSSTIAATIIFDR